MTEAQVGFLYNIASKLRKSGSNSTQTLLESFYLMRCKEITRGYGLPDKIFAKKARCPQCCLEWKKGTEIKVRPIKLSLRQKQRIKQLKRSSTKKYYYESRKALLHSNEMEQICTFCKHSTVTTLAKPEKQIVKANSTINSENKKPTGESTTEKPKKSKMNNSSKLITNAKINKKKKPEINIYSNAFDVFAINNKNNTLACSDIETPRVIQNNKKKKDKFAGLCQKAVLAASKLKHDKGKQDKLNLFLKPSK